MEKLKIKVADFFGTLILKIIMDLDDIIDTLITVAVTFVVCILVTNLFFSPVRVVGTSMHPTLKDKSFGFSNIVLRRLKKIDRFDIVVIKKQDKDERLVKRVIGMPGETVWYKNDCLYINGEPMDEPFLDQSYVEYEKRNRGKDLFTDDTIVYTLADDEYFCLGDNRIVSLDSRYYGPFSEDQIISVGVFVIFPLEFLGSAD